MLGLPDRVRPFLGVCFDCSHAAVMFENPRLAFAALADAGIPVAKIHVSSAVSLTTTHRQGVWLFSEPRYLHQTSIRSGKEVVSYRDLPDMLPREPQGDEEWRIHYHLPIFDDGSGDYGTTNDFTREVLRCRPPGALLEIETYTYDVLPPAIRPHERGGRDLPGVRLAEDLPVIRTVVLNVAGLSRSLLGRDTPGLAAFSACCATIRPLCPAVTCTMQATYLTGTTPAGHGIVGNGWFFRDLAEVMFWRQSNRLVQGEKIWHAARRRDSSFTSAVSFWWYNMATDADWSITPRPIYCADGRKIPDCYTDPPELRREFTEHFGRFPLFRFWGPATSIAATAWIARAARELEERFRPTLHLVYLPHLDYVLQREGPDGELAADLREIDYLCSGMVEYFRSRGCRVVVLSEYGITAVDRAVHPNRLLRQAGLLRVKDDLGREYLDPAGSRAFAVSDHQVAHLYVRDRRDIPAVQALFRAEAGVERVLDHEGKREQGLDHERAGDLVLVADDRSWFTYYFWEDDRRAPDFARTVNIHAKPGYDPCELLFDPRLRFPKLAVAAALLKKGLGMRSLLRVIPLDAGLIRGSHGRIPENPEQWPLLLSSEPHLVPGDRVEATEVNSILLAHLFSP